MLDCCPEATPKEVAVGKALHEFISTRGARCQPDHAGPWQHHYQNMARAALVALEQYRQDQEEKG